MHASQVFDTGITVVYEPEGGAALVDILFVHGLQGHPYKTWACQRTKDPKTPKSGSQDPSESPSSSHKPRSKKKLRNILSIRTKTRPDAVQGQNNGDVGGEPNLGTQNMQDGNAVPKCTSICWPADLLPSACPKARIMTWGYDTRVTKSMADRVNKNNVFAHGKDLLFGLQRERELDRPLIFVAHSLGGIIVKEVLASSYDSGERDLVNIVDSTAAVIFLGTPHRGSTDMAALGDIARKIASAVMMDTNSAMLDALGLKTSDLERCQESFSRVWNACDFRVKTFQEALPLTGIKVGLMNEKPANVRGSKVVPSFSSLLGDPREHGETLQANHIDMCRFSHAHDPNYRKVGGELQSIYRSIVAEASIGHKPELASRTNDRELTEDERACLRSLYFSEVETRYQTIDNPLDETCKWLLKSPIYNDWRNRRNLDAHHGLLWIKGKPGSGKSTLLKDMLKQIEEQESGSKLIASFFFNARGAELERRSLGLFRSLLHQILYQCRERLDEFLKDHWKKKHDQGAPVRWHTRELANFIRLTFSTVKMKSTILFVDALDECEGDGMRELVYFFRDLTTFAYAAGAQLNVCLSSRLYPTVTIQLCPELVVEDFNGADIAHYVRRKLAASINNDGDDWSQIERTILEKSSGVFLWVVLVADVLLRHRDEGRNFKSLERTLQRVPAALEDLFEQLLKGLSTNEVGVTVDFFRWVLLAARPLRLNEWHHVLGFISDRRPGSLREWRESDDHIENNDQLERRIRVISRGLVEVKKTAQQQLHAYYLDDDSVHAGAGSLDAYQDEVGGIQFIHESVREYFLTGKGFKLLNPLMGPCPLGQGHMFLFNTCLRYLHISELDALVSRRIELGSQTAASTPLSAYFLEWKEEGKFDGTFDVKCLGLKWPIKEKAQRRNRRGIQKRTMSVASFGSSASYIARSNHSAPVVGASESPSADPDAAPLDRDEMLKRYLASTEASPRKLPEGPVQSIISQIRPNMSIASEEFPDPPPDSPTRSASPIPSTTGFSIVLDELPALLSYSVDMLFAHASLAEAEGFTDVYSIIPQLSVLGGWQRWLALKEDLSTRTTLLYYVCERNLLSWVRALLELGTDCNQAGGEFGFPLIVAANACHEKVVALLLNHGADTTKTDGKGRTTLHHAVASSHLPLVRLLLEHLSSPAAPPPSAPSWISACDRFGQTPLHLAAWQASKDVVKELLDHGAQVDLKDSNWDTPLHVACDREQPDLEICRALLDAKPDLSIRNLQRLTAGDVAARRKFYEAYGLLKYGFWNDPKNRASQDESHAAEDAKDKAGVAKEYEDGRSCDQTLDAAAPHSFDSSPATVNTSVNCGPQPTTSL